MSETSVSASTPPKSTLGRSVLCILAGTAVVVAFSLGTDALLHYVAGFPKLGQVYSDRQFVWAIIYRTIYGVVGSYVTSRLAPRRPMRHSLMGGAIGVLVNAAGLVIAIIQAPKLGPAWYPGALLIGALPTAWLGAQIFIVQTSSKQ